MKMGLFFLGVLFLLSCKDDKVIPVEKNILDSLGLDDYREIIRHPISLEKSIDSSEWSKISFSEKVFNFDTLISGSQINKSFEFVNSGTKPLYILDTKVSCGCTVASFTEQAIRPGETGSIDILFDTEGKSGDQKKSIIVLSNSYPNEDRLFINGYLKSK